MALKLLVLAAAVAAVTAKYTVPAPIHFEVETWLQKVTQNKNTRWDPTNYLVYVSALYATCARIGDTSGLQQSSTFASVMDKLHTDLHPVNPRVYLWKLTNSTSGSSAQDAGTVDRDIRQVLWKGITAPSSVSGDTAALRTENYERFGCSVDINCGDTGTGFVLACVFANPPGQAKPVAGGGTVAPQTSPRTQAPTTTRRTVPTRGPVTARPQDLSGGLFATYRMHSKEQYQRIYKSVTDKELPTTFNFDDILDKEKPLSSLICKMSAGDDVTADLKATNKYDQDVVTVTFESTPLETVPPTSTLTKALDSNQEVKSWLESASSAPKSKPTDPFNKIACSWAVCGKDYTVGCALWELEAEPDAGYDDTPSTQLDY